MRDFFSRSKKLIHIFFLSEEFHTVENPQKWQLSEIKRLSVKIGKRKGGVKPPKNLFYVVKINFIQNKTLTAQHCNLL